MPCCCHCWCRRRLRASGRCSPGATTRSCNVGCRARQGRGADGCRAQHSRRQARHPAHPRLNAVATAHVGLRRGWRQLAAQHGGVGPHPPADQRRGAAGSDAHAAKQAAQVLLTESKHTAVRRNTRWSCCTSAAGGKRRQLGRRQTTTCTACWLRPATAALWRRAESAAPGGAAEPGAAAAGAGRRAVASVLAARAGADACPSTKCWPALTAAISTAMIMGGDTRGCCGGRMLEPSQWQGMSPGTTPDQNPRLQGSSLRQRAWLARPATQRRRRRSAASASSRRLSPA
jgi:hypothetical protein